MDGNFWGIVRNIRRPVQGVFYAKRQNVFIPEATKRLGSHGKKTDRERGGLPRDFGALADARD